MPGSFSGNGSVVWMVDGANVVQASSRLEPPDSKAPRRVVQDGTDLTDPGEFFTVVIKVPTKDSERRAFVKMLKKEAERLGRAEAGDELTLRVPIEDAAHNKPAPPMKDQILVLWKSSTTPRKA